MLEIYEEAGQQVLINRIIEDLRIAALVWDGCHICRWMPKEASPYENWMCPAKCRKRPKIMQGANCKE